MLFPSIASSFILLCPIFFIFSASNRALLSIKQFHSKSPPIKLVSPPSSAKQRHSKAPSRGLYAAKRRKNRQSRFSYAALRASPPYTATHRFHYMIDHTLLIIAQRQAFNRHTTTQLRFLHLQFNIMPSFSLRLL